MTRWTAITLLALILISVGGALLYEHQDALPADMTATYVGGQTCIACHQEQHHLFHGSHHDLAMDVATDETVLGRFDGTKIEHFGITSTVFKSGDRFMVNTEGADGKMQDFEVKMVFGYEPLQQYMVELKPPGEPDALGQYQVLRLSWDVEKQQWFYLTPPDVNEKLSPDDPLHWTSISQRWNTSCAICHSTNLQKNFDTLHGEYSTSYTDIDVNCESCHGPGSLHVKIAEKRRFLWDKNHGIGLVNKMKSNSNVTQVETCAPCHSRRVEICSGHQAGQRFNDHFACQLLSSQIYHDDGQIRDEDYVYGSFIQSKMFHQGIKCTDCHNPHSTKVKFNDNRLCTSCHQHPAGKYDSPSHHRHKAGSTGASCVECHMPSTTYMAVDPRRDHSLRVPRPDLSLKYGTPNACTACHLDKNVLPAKESQKLNQYLDWIIEAENGNTVVEAELKRIDQQMAAAFSAWYPDAPTNPKRSKYYEQLVIGKSDDGEKHDVLLKLAKDRSAPAIFRASAVETIDANTTELPMDELKELFRDDEPQVLAAALLMVDRRIANEISTANYTASASKGRTVDDLIGLVTPFLRHDSRFVRIAAARTLANIPVNIRTSGQFNLADYSKALEEFKNSLRVGNDLAANHMNLGGLFEADGKFEKAENAYRTAIQVEPEFAGPRSNLAALLEQRADQIRNQIIRSGSTDRVALGNRVDKLVAEARRLRAEENKVLKRDVDRAEHIAAAHGLFYRYGLSCYLMGDHSTAESYLLKAQKLSPDNENYLLGISTFYLQKNAFKQAIPFINRLIAINGNHPGYQRLRDEALNGLQQNKSD